MQVSSANQTFDSFPSSSGGETGDFEDVFSLKLNLNEDTEEQEEEFSFVCTNPDGSPISADDIFQNGQIRPVYPLFNRDILLIEDDVEAKNSSVLSLRSPLKKLFVEEVDIALSASSSEAEEPEGPYCNWTSKAVEASPEDCKKSNSTGFSKLRRFRELVLRSNSDGKDAFVFFHHDHHSHNPSTITSTPTKNAEKSEKVTEEKKKPAENKMKNGKRTSTSAHERLYVRNRELKEENKRKSYLPYRVGFFTNANGLSSNVHPY